MLNEQDSKTNALIEQLRTYDSAFEREIANALEQLVAERDEWQRGETIATKMVGELELEVTALKEVSDHHLRDVTNLCGHIAASEQRIKELEVENLEQARLLGMSGEREADLRGEVERLTAALKKVREVLDNCRGNINTERGDSDELERDIGEAIATITEALK